MPKNLWWDFKSKNMRIICGLWLVLCLVFVSLLGNTLFTFVVEIGLWRGMALLMSTQTYSFSEWLILTLIWQPLSEPLCVCVREHPRSIDGISLHQIWTYNTHTRLPDSHHNQTYNESFESVIYCRDGKKRSFNLFSPSYILYSC